MCNSQAFVFLCAMLLFFDFGTGEIFIIILIVLVFFGSKRLPEFARGLGKGIRQFKDAAQGIQDDISASVREVNADIAKARESVVKPVTEAAENAAPNKKVKPVKAKRPWEDGYVDSEPAQNVGVEKRTAEPSAKSPSTMPKVEPAESAVSRTQSKAPGSNQSDSNEDLATKDI